MCGVNMIGKFEHLERDLEIILKKIGIQQIIHNKKKINSSGNFNLKINKKMLKIINYLFIDDFINFHYKIIK
jgi:hypothetical protein